MIHPQQPKEECARTGAQKSELPALAQKYCGAAMAARADGLARGGWRQMLIASCSSVRESGLAERTKDAALRSHSSTTAAHPDSAIAG